MREGWGMTDSAGITAFYLTEIKRFNVGRAIHIGSEVQIAKLKDLV